MDQYKANTDLFDKDGKQIAKKGEITSNIPAKSVGWLLEQNLIEPAPASKEEKSPSKRRSSK